MAFSSYEEFRAAIADPRRRIEVVHNVQTSAMTTGFEAYMPQSALWVSTAPVASGGALLDHTSTAGSTYGNIGIPLRKPSVEGRSWYLYNVDAQLYPIEASGGIRLILADALWYATFSGTSPFTVTGAPDLTRYSDGFGVMAVTVDKPATGTSNAGKMTITGPGYLGGDATFFGFHSASVSASPKLIESWSPFAFQQKSATLGRGGIKKVSRVVAANGTVSNVAAVVLLKPLLNLPFLKPNVVGLTGIPATAESFSASPLFSAVQPFIRLAPGSDGNYACLIPIIHKAKSVAAVANDCAMRLQFVEG